MRRPILWLLVTFVASLTLGGLIAGGARLMVILGALVITLLLVWITRRRFRRP